MKIFGAVFVLVLCHGCSGRSVTDEDSVVSVYTTQPTTASDAPIGIYHQIANNIADRLASPIYRFFRIGNYNTTEKVNFKRKSIGILQIPDDLDRPTTSTTTSPTPNTRDVEVWKLSEDNMNPEKITFYSNSSNSTETYNLEPVEFDGDDQFFEDFDAEPTESTGYWELLTNFFKVLWGTIVEKFKPKTKSDVEI